MKEEKNRNHFVGMFADEKPLINGFYFTSIKKGNELIFCCSTFQDGKWQLEEGYEVSEWLKCCTPPPPPKSLEELGKKIKQEWPNVIKSEFTHSITSLFWDWLKPHLSALLKEKYEKIDIREKNIDKWMKSYVNTNNENAELREQIQELQTQLKEKEKEEEELGLLSMKQATQQLKSLSSNGREDAIERGYNRMRNALEYIKNEKGWVWVADLLKEIDNLKTEHQ